MPNACTVITRHERTPRGYYSGVAALFTPSTGSTDGGAAGHDLDAPILIRTAYLVDGRLRVPVGATLVRHSDPDGEVSETHGKAAGVLALGLYGVVATLQPDANFGRILAAYGGVFVAGSLLWAMALDGFRPDRWDVAGALICLAGVAVIMYAPRSS